MTSDLSQSIEAIPRDTSRAELPDRLEPIMEEIAKLDPARAEVCLSKIQFWFGLRRPEVEAYRRMLRQKQKELESTNTTPAVNVIMTADFPGAVDVAQSNGEIVFVVRKGNQVLVESEHEHEGTKYIPPPKAQIPWLPPRADEILRWYQRDTDDRLYEDLLNYHRAISDLPSAAHYHLIVAWVMHTYLLEFFHYSPILWFLAVPERGKSRTGKGMIHVARRGIHVECLREAYLLRAAQDLKATLFIDVMDLTRKLERSGSEDILLLRFEKGAKVPRVLHPDKGPHLDTVYYDVFGATIIGTNEPIQHILETRSVPIIQRQSHKRFENEVTPEGGRSLRERLIAFRARHLGGALPEVGKPMPGRLGDILKPLLQVVALAQPDHVSTMQELFRDLQKARLAQKAESLDAQILLAVQDCGQLATDGLIPVGDIVDHMNKEKSDKERLTTQKVGRRLVALGFERTRTGRNYAAILNDPDRLARVMATYGLQETPQTPQTPGPLSHNDLQVGVSPCESPGLSRLSGDHPQKLRPVTPSKQKDLEADGVSGVSGRFSKVPSHTPTNQVEIDGYGFEEDAAILEFDAGLSRQEAETKARSGRNGDER